MPGHTIIAVIKKFNEHTISAEELTLLLEQFTELNTSAVPRVGRQALIPVLDRIANK